MGDIEAKVTSQFTSTTQIIAKKIMKRIFWMLEKERSTENYNSYFGQGCGIAITTVFEKNIEELFEKFMLFFAKEKGKNEATNNIAIA